MEGKNKVNGDSPMIDDGWWASVLADEEEMPKFPQQQDSNEPQEHESLNWDLAKETYQEDQIVQLKVKGYNRGGLLVSGDCLYGFVPCSHLVAMPMQAENTQREHCLAEYVGRTLRLKIIECVPEEGRLVFSERAALAKPGQRSRLFETLQVGQSVSGEVTNITDFGVFVDLGGLEGLIHISELSWGRVSHPSQMLQVGQQIKVVVLDVLAERCRVALSLKRLFPNPWLEAGQRYPENSVVPATITALASFGAFARLEEGLEGLIHVSEMTIPPGSELKDVLEPGQAVKVRILRVDPGNQRLSLSLRDL